MLEPEVLEYVPENWSSTLFGTYPPPTLATGAKLTGYEGAFYWSDIGTLEACRTAEQDVFAGRVRINILGTTLDARRPGNLWNCRGARAPPYRHFI